MRQIRLKAMLRAQPPGEWLEQAHRHLELGAALTADKVAVPVRIGEMPPRDAILEVRVCRVAELLERFEVAVDGRWVDLRMLRANARGDLLRGGVVLRALQRFEHQPALDRHALAARANVLADLHYRNSLATTCTLQ